MLGSKRGCMKEVSTKDSTKYGFLCLGLAVWFTSIASVAWLMLWTLSGEPWSSFLAVVGPMALIAAKLDRKTDLDTGRIHLKPAPSVRALSAS